MKGAIDEYERKKVGHSPWMLLDHLYLANGLSAQSRPTVLEKGITHVMNLAADEIEVPVFYEFKNIKTERISAKDELGYDMLQHHQDVFDFIEEVRKSGGKVRKEKRMWGYGENGVNVGVIVGDGALHGWEQPFGFDGDDVFARV